MGDHFTCQFDGKAKWFTSVFCVVPCPDQTNPPIKINPKKVILNASRVQDPLFILLYLCLRYLDLLRRGQGGDGAGP